MLDVVVTYDARATKKDEEANLLAMVQLQICVHTLLQEEFTLQ